MIEQGVAGYITARGTRCLPAATRALSRPFTGDVKLLSAPDIRRSRRPGVDLSCPRRISSLPQSETEKWGKFGRRRNSPQYEAPHCPSLCSCGSQRRLAAMAAKPSRFIIG